MDETTLDLLSGGFHHCDPTWSRHVEQGDKCFKAYFPRTGKASVTVNGRVYPLQAGHVYFIPGYGLRQQTCLRAMAVDWVHFVPRSLYLMFLLSHVSQVHSWPASALTAWAPTYRQLDRYFATKNQPLLYRIQAMLLFLIAEFLEQYNFSHMAQVDPIFEHLRPAITYMDDHFRSNPSLAEIASAAHLAPNYFHRLFSQTFQITPHGYLFQRRMSLARQLLLGTSLSVGRIAEQCGYDSPFHFSRRFHHHFDLSPLQMRRCRHI